MQNNKTKKQFNTLLAPIVIAGITAGFLVSAYRFVFVKNHQNAAPEQPHSQADQQTPSVQSDPAVTEHSPDEIRN